MGSRGRPIFDLNELPTEEEEESDGLLHVQPSKLLSSATLPNADMLLPPQGCNRIVNNHAFSHAYSLSGFQPFVRASSGKDNVVGKEDDSRTRPDLPSMNVSNNEEDKGTLSENLRQKDAQITEKEEGEWSYMEGNNEGIAGDNMGTVKRTEAVEKGKASESISQDEGILVSVKGEIVDSNRNENNQVPEQANENSKIPDTNVKGDASADSLEETSFLPKPREVKGIEASHALKCANNPGKRNKIDQHKEAMLGKKRNRQTMFLNLEDVKQAGPIKTSTPRRQNFSSSLNTRTVKEIRNISAPPERVGEKQGQFMTKDQKQMEGFSNEGIVSSDLSDHKSESNGDANQVSRFKKLNGSNDSSADCPPIPRHNSWKQPADPRQMKNHQGSSRKLSLVNQNKESADSKSGNKKHLPLKKINSNSLQYQDTSVERLLREVTNEKFWHHPEETDLQCVPGKFDSVEEYVRVFEPLLFEECRAQLYSTWEESSETVSKDAHVMVRIKYVEKRERGWYDAIVLPLHECKWTFKEGDVAVLSTLRPGGGRSKRNNISGVSEDDVDSEVTGRVAGTVRRHIPVDTRDPPGAILHFYVGDAYDSNSKIDDDHVLRKLQLKNVWCLTVLGSLATTQREYIAIHAFRRLNLQMQTAILKPSPEHFPKYEEHTPAMPDCFTQNFVDYLHRTFNGPQLAAIQWAAMHTAAGTSGSGTSKRQEPWPFTLVQGPPGTGKTHTVWGMLNVIHLVQYQHYYTALLKKLAPESYKQVNESNSESVCSGSIDEVLQSMDQNLFRTLPKLCPKPRMLVCAPSNAATDELLARVLDRGFIDGEMKVYRPDVARVGVDSQTRAAQAVSVERRTEQLLVKGREEIIGWMHQLKAREAQFSQQIACLQRELNVAAAAGRSQGSVGVDPDVLVARDHNRDSLLQNLAAVVEGRDKVLVEMSRLFILEGRFRPGSNFNLEEARSNLEASFANEAEIVFTTVSSSGRKLFSRLTHGFDMVVIDEAAQASEVAVLPPLALGAARCVLVGDPQQLPATVISKAAGTLLYSRSLFERFQQAGCPTMLLSVQYRMHPQIRDFPSRYFYQGRLTDSESVANMPDEMYYKDPLLKPYVFYDITHGRESHRGGSVSYQNIHEAQFCLRLYEHLQKTLKSLGVNNKVSVGIITPYKLQLKCLQREFEEVLNSEEGRDLYINTVDAFQGQERDVIIMSCVRASNHGVGFVADIRRMNVALTRARRALWVMGNATALVQSDDWAALISDAKMRNCFVDMDSIPKEFFGPKSSSGYTPVKGPSSIRGGRMGGPRYNRQFDMHPEPRSGTPSEDDEKLNSFISRNGSYRNLKLPPVESSLDDLEQSRKRQHTGGH
ncbi:hypothetical protein H6P81_011554 [Aristolochia fimbriata]|uniref:Uncharacterized protein n=1 Tax=Aristolochia fimbriata TaxID=158543 RepID=A0AAV7ESM2_ARIFI|nr:hypothetical protein H6P81_011554 [Aristolochia fimbriata]